MDRINRKCGGSQQGVGTLQDADGSYVAVGIPGKYQDRLPLRDEDFVVYMIQRQPVRVFQLSMGTKDLANWGHISVRVSLKGQNRKGVILGYHDLIADGIVGHVVNRTREESVLSSN